MKRMIRPLSLWMLLAATLLAWQSAAARGLPDFTELVEEAAPGVVNISTTRTVQSRDNPLQGFGGQELPEIFRHFFGDRFPAPPGGSAPGRPQERQSLGSGFIISDDGYILTNAHVVDGADEILVRLSDRRELAAELVGSDERTDVALLKVDADALPTLKLGDSDVLRVGEWVAAIGSPFGFDHSVTAGIVSAIDRTLPRDAYVPFIQTDVAINPGNSGGPLFNLDGEVVGINSQIFTRSGGFMGLSFAIPINVAMDVADQLRDDGQVRRGWLGVMIQPVSRDLAESFGMESPSGALIADLDPEGPAARGGLQAGDVILEVDGSRVHDSSTLPRLIGRTAPGSEVELELMRDGQRRQLTVTVGDWPDAERATASRPQESRQARLGISVGELERAEREQIGIEGGVRVREVDPDGAAAAAGIRPGDILVSIDHRAVTGASQLVELVSELPADRAVPVRLYRDGRSLFVALRLAAD
ncbi:DegQ family serine endoprotease [Halomonas sp. JS92-SW72]|uniref:DegQ family serine endoprotease n=1 Tax=Halomonas sp. JS92-SW72 TaxID=2306583 RepID=UPI000E5A7D76|nr:DegQ family serine endoprotease [Halomonas sp. JS92-SW72]AXY42702.1 DegQ family serine endoprotease [Halomonas sp. JS92-SW72]